MIERKDCIFVYLLIVVMMSHTGSQIRASEPASEHSRAREKQLTHGPGGRILTNTGVWSPDGKWIVYDTRSNVPGEDFNGSTIEMVNVTTGEIQEIYRFKNGAHCGVVTFHPRHNEVVFILGPEAPSP